jgi:hypothetical protein
MFMYDEVLVVRFESIIGNINFSQTPGKHKKRSISIMASEPGQLVLTILDQLVDRIKSSRPLRTDGKPLTEGFVYSQLVLGRPIAPRDYMNAWTPGGDATVKDAVGATASGTTPPTDPKVKSSVNAAWLTSQLVDDMIMVTDDDSLLEYKGGGRHISFAYEGIINGMQPTPMPPIPADIQKQIDDSTKILYQLDADGNIIGKSPLYKNYVKNAGTYADAKKVFADAQAAAQADQVKAQAWPVDSATYQQKVNDAWDAWKTEGADKVERALDIIKSVGISLQDHMIAKARQVFDAWNLGLTGAVATKTPYSYISPSTWADPTDDTAGWQQLTVGHSDYQNHKQSHYRGQTEEQFSSSSSSGSAGVGVFLGFINVAGEASASSSNTSSSGKWQYASQQGFSNSATSLSIDLEYALLDIYRPWYIGDLFYMPNWYLVNNAKNIISDGSVQGQVKNEKNLLPMIPVQILAIRNVRISSQSWGSDGDTISKIVDTSSSSSSSSSVGGSGGVSLGFINFGGSYQHSDSSSDAKTDAQNDASSDFKTYWDGQTLAIHGTQIFSWLSDILPACAPLDDPHLHS